MEETRIFNFDNMSITAVIKKSDTLQFAREYCYQVLSVNYDGFIFDYADMDEQAALDFEDALGVDLFDMVEKELNQEEDAENIDPYVFYGVSREDF